MIEILNLKVKNYRLSLNSYKMGNKVGRILVVNQTFERFKSHLNYVE